MRWPSRSACSSGACKVSGSASPSSRYRAIAASSTSTTCSITLRWTSATERKSALPASFAKQSMTRVPPSAGKLIGRHSGPNVSCSCFNKAGSAAFSASMRLMITMRQRLRCAAQCNMRRVISSMPLAALITTATVSTASSAPSAWPNMSGCPGVSMR